MLKFKLLIIKILKIIAAFLDRFRLGRVFLYEVINYMMNKEKKIIHNDVSIVLSVPNRLTHWRAETFSKKEPETLDWIDTFEDNEVLWDIGANIGLYSLYAAKKKNCKVYCFEPSVFNLEILARNIYINNFINQIFICPFAVSDKNHISILKLQSKEWSGALSSFDHDFGFDGKMITESCKYNVFGFKIDDICEKLGLENPDHIKIDVDGIEHIILSGADNLLLKVKSVHIEINDDFIEQANKCSEALLKAGLILSNKEHSNLIEGSSGFNNVYNQTWRRKF